MQSLPQVSFAASSGNVTMCRANAWPYHYLESTSVSPSRWASCADWPILARMHFSLALCSCSSSCCKPSGVMGNNGVPVIMKAVCAGNEKAAVQQLQQGLEASKAISFWLYNMLAQPYSTDQLLLKGRVPTQLSAVVNSSTYDLGFNATGMRGNEVSFSIASCTQHAC